MESKKYAKIAALFITLTVIVLSCLPISLEEVGLSSKACWVARLSYPFFHANIAHALINAWTLLCLVFYYEMNIWQLLLAYGIAVTFPTSIFPTTVTVGLSGVCFGMMGILSFLVKRRLYWQIWMAVFLVIGFVIPQFNGTLHLYCYLLGVAIGFFFMPVKRI